MASTASSPKPDESAWADLRKRLVSYFAHRGCADSDEAAQETLTRLFERVEAGTQKIEGKDGFAKVAFGYARFVLKDKRRAALRASSEDPVESVGGVLSCAADDDIYMDIAVSEVLSGLSPDQRKLLLSVTWNPDEVAAKKLGITLNNLHVRVFRLRERLWVLVRAYLAAQPHPARNPEPDDDIGRTEST